MVGVCSGEVCLHTVTVCDSKFDFMKLVVGGFLLVLRFPPLLVSANKKS